MGYSVDVYNTEGKIVSKVDLNADLFSDEQRSDLCNGYKLYEDV